MAGVNQGQSDFRKCYAGQRVTIMGLGRFGGGLAAARFLATYGGLVSVTDLRQEDGLKDSIEQLDGLPIIETAFGQHPEHLFRQCDLLVVNPAVRPDHPLVKLAAQLGVDVSTEIDLFLRHNPAPVIAVTGSNGKSTTTAVIHHLLLHTWQNESRRTWLGGNIGISLLEQLPQISANDRVVLELSSFQLELLRLRRFRPEIAVITNFAANHLDWHGTVEAYRRAKQGILDAQHRQDAAVLPEQHGDEPDWRARGRVFRFGLTDSGDDGGFIEDSVLSLRATQSPQPNARGPTGEPGSQTESVQVLSCCTEEAVRFVSPPQLVGQHNRRNLAAACCAAWLAGACPEKLSDAVQSFVPLPHRLQQVCERFGRRFYNDSIATTPESAIQALRAFSNRLILLAGGYDKGQDLRELATEIRMRAAVVVLMGDTAKTLETLITSASPDISSPQAGGPQVGGPQVGGPEIGSPEIVTGTDFQDSFRQAVLRSRSGDIILLSPGCASYGWFRDYRERGDLFSSMAAAWTPET